MEISLERRVKTDISTIGRLFVDSVSQCYTLEDKDRDLVSTMPASTIAKIKVFGHTAIPRGRYQVIMSYSERFKKFLPLLLNVPGFAGVRIHTGNCPDDTEGCLLTGSSQGKNWISQSREAFADLIAKIEAASKTERVFITIK